MKRLFIFIAAIFVAATALGQTALPNDPAVRVGKLDNGMTYYIRHNDQPAQRAEFYLATDIGAFQEEDHQDGLAHFLEHMCFNGTKNFPGKGILNWLQSIGAEFGRNINASTGLEQTQYMLNNIPIVRETIIDSCLLILHDYSHFVTNDPAEIDAERGVIQEERRTTDDASWRLYLKARPYYYGDTPYARRSLIGSEEQLATFKYESLTSFYETWCRPDLQAVVVVGDVDVDQIEAKLKTIFADIPAPVNPKEKVLHKIPDNVEPIVGILTDPEQTSSSVEILWKSEPLPKEYMNTDVAFMTDLIKSYISLIMRERFTDITAQPGAPFLGASFYPASSLTASCDATQGSVSFKDGDAVNAFTAFMTEIEKMKRYGFTDGEVQRAKDNIISRYERAVEAAPTRKNAEYVRPLINNFYRNTPFMEPETELQLAQAVCAQLTAPVLNQVVAQLITDENIVVLYNGPEREGLANPTEADLLGVLAAVKNAEIKANVEDAVNEPFISGELKGSPVKKTKETIYGATEWTLKNGVKVIVHPTEYKKDQVLMTIKKKGGSTLIADEDMTSFESNIISMFINNSGISKFSNTQVSKMLAGKNLSVTPSISNIEHGITATSTPKDLETAFQLMYLLYTDPRFDEAEFETTIQQIKAILPNIAKTPDFIFSNKLIDIVYGNDPRNVKLNEETLEKANLATIERVYRELFKDAAGATLLITGNVDLATLQPMVEKYIGSIPKGKKATEIVDENVIKFVKGKKDEVVELTMETPKSTVVQIYTAYMPVDTKTELALEIANYVLDMIYTKSIREDEGGTYGVGTAMAAQRLPEEMVTIQVQFDTNVEMADRLRDIATKGLKDMAEKGLSAEHFNMAVENLKKNLPESRINNSYWGSVIDEYYKFGIDYDAEYEAALNSITAADVQAVIKAVLDQNNLIQVKTTPKK